MGGGGQKRCAGRWRQKKTKGEKSEEERAQSCCRAAASGRAGWVRWALTRRPARCFGDSPRSQRAPACVSLRRRCAELRPTYHSIQSSCSSMSAVRKHSRSLLPTPEACTAQASRNSSPATNTFSPYWLLSASASFCGKLARMAPRRGAGDSGDSGGPGAGSWGGGQAAGPDEPLSGLLRNAWGEAGAPWPSGIIEGPALSLVPGAAATRAPPAAPVFCPSPDALCQTARCPDHPRTPDLPPSAPYPRSRYPPDPLTTFPPPAPRRPGLTPASSRSPIRTAHLLSLLNVRGNTSAHSGPTRAAPRPWCLGLGPTLPRWPRVLPLPDPRARTRPLSSALSPEPMTDDRCLPPAPRGGMAGKVSP